jgi:AcrR family transcriptional regulator
MAVTNKTAVTKKTKVQKPSSDNPQAETPETEREYNNSGQRFGKKGRQVSDNLLQAARKLMVDDPLTIPTLTAVTAAAGVKITSVYRYYPDVNTLLVDAMQPMVKEIAPVTALMEAEWPKGKEFQRALEFSRALYEYWRDRRGVLFVRNSLAERGDPRFVKLRLDWARPMLIALGEKFSKAHSRPVSDPRDVATARILIPGLERTLTMLLHSLSLGPEVVGEDVPDPLATASEVREAFAHIVASLMNHDYLEE